MSNHHFTNDVTNDGSPLVLAVDTSSAVAGFALAQGGKLLASLNGDAAIPHSRAFFLSISELLKIGGIRLEDVQLFAAATGPGSFTGLRVGLAAIKGLAHSLGKPAVGINSIDALALSAKVTGEVEVLIEAGRSEVYSGVRFITGGGDVQLIGEDRVGALSSVPSNQIPIVSHLPPSRLAEVSSRQIIKPARIIAEEIALRAPKLLELGADNGLRPHYIRPSDAEIKRKD
ncbi:MAG: tRNA (adenosine(37)-N6)-threonylcarbamoyltransferase complex dimerization subunit type 1 TsaB [Blastocatellia bacterium]